MNKLSKSLFLFSLLSTLAVGPAAHAARPPYTLQIIFNEIGHGAARSGLTFDSKTDLEGVATHLAQTACVTETMFLLIRHFETEPGHHATEPATAILFTVDENLTSGIGQGTANLTIGNKTVQLQFGSSGRQCAVTSGDLPALNQDELKGDDDEKAAEALANIRDRLHTRGVQ